MQKYFDTVISDKGRPVVGASIVVKKSDGTGATIYSDNGVTVLNSLATDANGAFAFYAADGRYNVQVWVSGVKVRQLDDVLLEDQASAIAAAVPAATLSASGGSALVGHGSDTVASVLDALHLADYAALRAYTGNRKSVYVTGYLASAAPSGIAGLFTLDSSDTTTADNGGTVIVATNGKRWKRVYDGGANIQWFGAVGDGGTNNDAALAAARNWAATRSAAGNVPMLIWPAGRYVYSASPNWAINRLHIAFQGEVWLIPTGTGNAFDIDGGATGAGVYGMKITGYPLLYGGASSGHGVFMRAIHRSHLEIEPRGAGTAYAGLRMEWCVSNTIYFVMNNNAGGLYSMPAYGIVMANRGATDEETSYNTFINPECSGMPIGIYQDGALGNAVIGGAVQACSNVGLQQTVNAWNNKFIGTDFEVNTNADIVCDARESQFYGVDSYTLAKFTANAVNCQMHGGTAEDIEINAGAARTLLSGVVYNRFGSGSITDNGTATRYRDITNKASGVVSNTPRARDPLTVGASPYTYTNTTGNEVDVLVTGGTITQLVYTRFAGDIVASPEGMFRLSPGDSMTVTYTVAPSMIAYTR